MFTFYTIHANLGAIGIGDVERERHHVRRISGRFRGERVQIGGGAGARGDGFTAAGEFDSDGSSDTSASSGAPRNSRHRPILT